MATIERVVTFSAPGPVGSPAELKSRYENFIGRHLLDETLCARVDELIRSHKCKPLLSTTGSRALIEELAARSEGLEEAIREIALEVQEVAASQKGTSDPAEAGAGDRTVRERCSPAL